MAKTALITGASSGIGHAFAMLLAKENYGLVLIARRTDKLSEIKRTLEKTYPIKIHIISKDLSMAGSAAGIFDELDKERLPIDLLVNNAGFGVPGPFIRTDWGTELQMMQLNTVNLVHLTKLIIPQMVERRNGGVINVASTVGFVPGPFMSIYHATKAFVLSFSQALAYELKDTGVRITALCPGPTRTEFQEKAGIGNTRSRRGMACPGKTAQYGYRAWLKGRTVAVHGLKNKVLVTSTRLLPTGLITGIMGRSRS